MRTLLLVLVCCLLFGCKEVKKPEKPENLIGKATMVDILTEAYLSNAARSISSKTIREKGIQLDSIIYKKYNIDSLQFVKSNAYYTSDLNTYTNLFERVEQRLLAYKVEVDSLDLKTKTGGPIKTKDTLDGKPKLVTPVSSETDQEGIE